MTICRGEWFFICFFQVSHGLLSTIVHPNQVFLHPIKITIHTEKAHYFTKIPHYITTRMITPRSKRLRLPLWSQGSTQGPLDMKIKNSNKYIQCQLNVTRNICDRNNLYDRMYISNHRIHCMAGNPNRHFTMQSEEKRHLDKKGNKQTNKYKTCFPKWRYGGCCHIIRDRIIRIR